MAVTTEYTAAEIQVLTSREAVRKRPGMYIGSTDSSAGLHLLLWEVLGNALDEYVAGHGRSIAIRVDGTRVVVEDDGRGLPHGAIERVFTTLHAGTAKRPHRHLALDLHAVGVSITNFLSRTFEITTWRDGLAVAQRFAQGTPQGPVEHLGPATRTGTRIAFEPDFTILAPRPWDVAMIRERCRELAGIEPGLAISVDDETFSYASLGDYLRVGREIVAPLDVNVIENDIGVRAALGWHAGKKAIRTLVNGSPSNGAYVARFHAAIDDALANKLGRRIAKRRIERGLVAALHVTLDQPRFGNPTKAWLRNPEVGDAVHAVITRALERHFDEAPAALDALLLLLDARARRR